MTNNIKDLLKYLFFCQVLLAFSLIAVVLAVVTENMYYLSASFAIIAIEEYIEHQIKKKIDELHNNRNG